MLKPVMDIEEELAVYKRRCDAASSSEDRDSVLREMLTETLPPLMGYDARVNPYRDFDSTLGHPGGPPEVGCECCPPGPAGRVQAKRPWTIDVCGFCARPAQRNKWGYRCIECSTFWCDANCRDRHALTHRCRCRRKDTEARASPAQETDTQDAVLPPLPPPPMPPPMPVEVLPSGGALVEFEEPAGAPR